jgi:hypothetical protein
VEKYKPPKPTLKPIKPKYVLKDGRRVPPPKPTLKPIKPKKPTLKPIKPKYVLKDGRRIKKSDDGCYNVLPKAPYSPWIDMSPYEARKYFEDHMSRPIFYDDIGTEIYGFGKYCLFDLIAKDTTSYTIAGSKYVAGKTFKEMKDRLKVLMEQEKDILKEILSKREERKSKREERKIWVVTEEGAFTEEESDEQIKIDIIKPDKNLELAFSDKYSFMDDEHLDSTWEHHEDELEQCEILQEMKLSDEDIESSMLKTAIVLKMICADNVETILDGKEDKVEYQFHHETTPYYKARLICYNNSEGQEAKDEALSFLGSDIFSEKGLTKLVGEYAGPVKKIMVSEKQRASEEEGEEEGGAEDNDDAEDDFKNRLFTS